MNHCVPDFDMDDEYSNSKPKPSPSASRTEKDDDIMELLWQNGQVVAQSQTQRKSPARYRPAESAPPQPPPQPENTQLFIGEDEMANWLHYPLEDLYTDLLYPTSSPAPQQQPPPAPPPTATLASAPAGAVSAPEFRLQLPAARPPVPPPLRNFAHFSRFRGRPPTEPVSAGMTVVDSNRPTSKPPKTGIPATAVEGSAALSRAPPLPSGVGLRRGGGGSGDMTSTSASVSRRASGSGSSSASGSGTSGAAGVGTASAAAAEVEAGERKEEGEDRKRKRREIHEGGSAATIECHTEDVEQDSADEKRHSRSSAAKRSRAAEVHNLSERRRRDRINEKMKDLQELIPRCDKSDKASMLDEAIEYLKSLQMQVQMMSMGCGMVPMMYPLGMQQQYMPPMGMGMGMGMGMDMGMSRPMMSFPIAVPPSPMPTTPSGSVVFTTPTATGAPPQLAPRFPIPAFPMPPVPQPVHPRIQASTLSEPIRNPVPIQTTPGLPQFANMADPYQQYMALQQMQMQMQMQAQMQSQSVSQPGSSKPNSSKPSTSMSEEDFDDSQCG